MFKKKLKQKIRKIQLYLKYYSFFPSSNKTPPCIVFMLNNVMMHGGLLDRIKGIITASVIAEHMGYALRVYVDKKSFNLFKFILPVDANIIASEEDVKYNVWTGVPVLLYNLTKIKKEEIIHSFRGQKSQYHLYCNLDLLKQFYPCERQEGLNGIWRGRFNSLFTFNSYFSHFAEGIFCGATNICGIHLRFVSLLGDFKEVVDNALPQEEKSSLVNKCLGHIRGIIETGLHEKYLVVSDSVCFLNDLRQSMPNTELGGKLIVLDGGAVAHIDLDHSEEVLQKTILDFYLLSRCSVVYQVLAAGMYNSQFCRYAAVLGNATYKIDKI